MNDLIARRDGETDLQYHRRLVYGKLEDKTLSDVDYTELAEAAYGQPYASDVARRMFYGSKRTLDIIERESMAVQTDVVPADIEARIAEMKVERQKLFDQRAAFNKSVREVARQQELSEIIRNAVESGSLNELSWRVDPSDIGTFFSQAEESGRDLLVSLNDIHYGATVDNHWRKYNSSICKSMFEKYLNDVIRIAKESGAENCYIYNAGDAISGSIHRSIQVSNRENVIQQVCGVSELISNFIAELAPYFRHVTYVSVAGNHSRIEANKKDAIVAERLDNLIGWYLEARLQNLPNVTIANDALIDDTMFMLDIRGKKYVGVHGDFDNTTSSVQAIKAMCGEDMYAILSGHLHHNKIDSICGVKSVMAGSFLGMDEYCVSRRIVGNPEQMVNVVDENGIICSYDIQF